MSKLISLKTTLPLIFILLLTASQIFILDQNKDSLIAEVENGLLPYVIIEGEPSFNLEERMKYYKVPGISVAVIKDYKVEWIKHYGVMDAELQDPVTDETIFNVGSLSKGVAALTVLSLVDEGKIELHQDVNEQLISWKIPENEFTKQNTVTPFLLMNHSGGTMYSPSFSYLPENFPTILQVLKGESPAQFKPVVVDRIPGKEFMYSNAGYSTLQLLTTDVTGQTFPEVTKARVLKPLDLSNSTFQQPLPEDYVKNASAGHMNNGLPLEVKRYYYPHMAAGGLWSTTADYAKYVIELQKSFHGKSNKIISKELVKEMLSSHVSEQYGLGVFIRNFNGEKNYFGHLGDNKGFFAGFASHIRDGYGAVVFTNSQNGANLIREITRGISKVYNWENHLPEEYKIVELTYENLDKYCGRYLIGSDDLFEIRKDQNKLFINRFDNAQLYHVGEEKFVTKFRDGYLQFETDGDSISSVVYYLSDELGRFVSEPITCNNIDSDFKIPIELLNQGNFEEAAKLYRKIKTKNPFDRYVSENRFNNLGYKYLGQNKYEEAMAVFNLNVEFYPKSANSYDSLAEAYMKSDNRELAIINYNKSLELNPANQNAIKMLKELQKK